jgi:DNA-binding MurR/RpiR family transcriptional regulator
MTNQNLLDRINALKKLTPSESKIADFLSRHYPEIVFDNVTSISKKTGVSKATVVRFFLHLGF